MKRLSIFLMIILVIVSVSAASAADLNQTGDVAEAPADNDDLEIDGITENLQAEDSTDNLRAGQDSLLSANDLNFTKLDGEINQAGVSEFSLDGDYVRQDSENNIEIDKDFTINGNGRTIDANNLGGIFVLHENCHSLTLNNLTLKNINDVGCIKYDSSSNGITITLNNVNFTDNWYRSIEISNGDVNLTGCSFINCEGSNGAAIYCNGIVNLTDCRFENITGHDNEGGAIYCYGIHVNNANFTNCILEYYDYGGAIYVDFKALDANPDYALIDFKNVAFTNSKADSMGGAIYLQFKNMIRHVDKLLVAFENATFENGLTQSGSSEAGGGAVFFDFYSGMNANYGLVSFDNVNFTGNTVPKRGGAVYMNGLDTQNIEVNFTNCIFENNTAKGDLGGGAFYILNYGDSVVVNMIDTSFVNNNADNYGGAIYATVNLNLTDCTFKINTADEYSSSGGAIYTKGAANLTGCTFGNNNAYSSGGAMYIEGVANLVGCTFGNNSVYDYSYGGGAIFSAAGLNLTDCTFDNNTVPNSGGAIYNYNGNLNVVGSKFTNNTAYVGGAVYNYGSLNVADSTFIENKAYATGLNVDEDTNTLNITLEGYENYFNAIYSENPITYDNITYWNGELVSDVEDNTGNRQSGQNITIEIYDDQQTLKANISLLTSASGFLFKDFRGIVPEGDYTYRAYHPDDRYYTSIEKDSGGPFHVEASQTEVNLTVEVENIQYGQNATIVVTLKDMNGNNLTNTVVNVTINNVPYEVTVINGKGSRNVSGLAAKDNYLANATFKGNESYAPANATDYFNVTKAQSLIEIYEINNVTNREAVNVMFNVTGASNVTYVVKKRDGTPVVPETVVYNVNATDNVVILTLGVGDYIISITAPGNENYTGDVKSANFTVSLFIINGTYTDLQNRIDNAAGTTLDLPYDFAFLPGYDDVNNPDFVNGVMLNKTLTVNGNGHTISGNNSARILNITSEAVLENIRFINGSAAEGAAIYNTVDDMIITNCTFYNNSASSRGGAIYINASGKAAVNMINASFADNTAGTGGAVYILADDLNLMCEDTSFVKNTLFYTNGKECEGGALYVNATAANAMFRNATFAYNGVSDLNMANSLKLRGGAIRFYSLYDGQNCINFTDSRFINNTGYQGGGISLDGLKVADMYFNNTNFTGNAANSGGAMYLESLAKFNMYLTGVNLKDNYAEGTGGAIGLISLSSGNCDLYVRAVNTTFEKNHALSDGAMFVSSAIPSCNFTLNCTSTEFRDNKADYTAGALNIEGCTVNIINATFTNNTAAGRGGAINNWASMTLTDSTFTNNTAADGGAISNWEELTVINTSFDGNNAVNGGAVYNWNEYSPAVMTLKDSSFADNTAVNGGAVYIADGTVQFNSSCTFSNNSASGSGGAIFIKSNNTIDTEITFYSSFFLNNTADGSGGAIFVEAAGDGSSNFELVIRNPHFDNNTAGENGGAIALQGNNMGDMLLFLENGQFYNNTADADGGAIYYNSTGNSKLSLYSGVRFEDNRAFRGGALSLRNVGGTYYDAILLKNKANSTNITYVHENDNLTLTFSGHENYLNAIYAENWNPSYVDSIEYWDGAVVNLNGADPVKSENESGINIALEIDNNGTLINLTTDKSGQVHFSTLGLSDGIHTFRVFHAEDDYYTFIERTGQFMVQSVVTNLTVSVENIVYGQNATVNVTLTDINGNNMTGVDVNVTIDNKIYIIHIENGKGSINNVSGLAAGVNYLANATFGGIPSFGASNATDYFNVTKAQSLIEIYKINNVAYGEAVRVMFNVTDVANVTYVVQKRDGTPVVQETVVLNLNATDNVIVLALDAGNYTITITGAGNENYTGDVFAAPFTVYKGDLAVGVAAENITPLDNGKVNITSIPSDFVGNVSIVVDGVTVYNGTPASSIDIGRFSVGNKTAKVTFYGDDNYAVRTVDANFTVNKAVSSIVISPIANVTFPEYVMINFTVVNPTVVNWTVVNKKTGAKSSRTGLNNISEVWMEGNYTITIENQGNDNVTGYVATADFTVYKAGSLIVIDPIVNVTYPESSVINFTVVNATVVNWTIVNRDTGAKVISGIDSRNITVALAAGNYTITIENEDTIVVRGYVASANFTVNKVDSSVAISPIANVTYPDPVVINFTASNASDVNWTIVNKDTGDVITGSGLENITRALAAGNYTVTIESKGNVNVTGFVASADFTVAKANSTVTITPIVNVTYNATVSVSYVVVNDTVVSYEVVDATGAVVVQNTTVSDLSVPIALAGLNAGNYTIVIANAENENYTASSAKANFTVFKANSTVNASDITSVYGTNPKLVFSTENATSVNITVLDENNTSVFDRYFVTNNQVNLPVLFVGNYTIRLWTNPLNDNYAVGFNEYNWTITKKNSNVIIWNVANVTYDATARVEFSVSGKTNLTYIVKTQAGGTIVINTTEIARIDEIRTILTLKVLKPGNYTITITNAENENYVASSASANFTVFKAGSLVDITRVDNVTYNSNVSVVFGVINSTNVTYTLTYANGTVIVKDKHAGTSLILENLRAGNYTITVTNAENENYTGSSDSANFTVFKAGSLVNINPIVNVTYPGAITVNYGVENRTNVTYTLSYANGTVVAENVEISDSTITLANLRAGNYTITIANAEAENYTGDVKSANFTVFKAPSNVTVVVDNVTYDAVVGVDVTVVNATVVTYTLKYANGTVIVENVPVSNLTKNLTLTLGAGNYTISVFNAENNNYTASEFIANFTVFKAGSLVTIYQVNNVTYNASVSVVCGVRNSTNVTYTLSYVNGTVIVKDVRVGETLILTNLGAGNYTITIANAENENYTGSSASANFTVFKAGSDVGVVVDNVTYDAVVGVDVTVVNATVVTYTLKYANGTVIVENVPVSDLTKNLTLTLGAGNYTITVFNAEGDNYTASEFIANFTVFKAGSLVTIYQVNNVTYNASVSVVCGVRNSTNVTYTLSYANGTVIVKDVRTGESLILSGLGAGNYTILITNAENENYTGSSASANFTVFKADSLVTIDPIANVTYNATVTVNYSVVNDTVVTYEVTDASGNVVANATVDQLTGVIVLPVLKAGNYTIIISNAENENYTGDVKSANFTVFKANSTLNVSDITFDYGKEGNTTVTYTGASDVTAVIDGQDPTVIKIENGIITVSGLAAGNWTMNVTTVPDENHTEVSKMVNVTVNKVPSTLDVSNVTFAYGEEGNTTVSFTGAVNVTAVVTGHSEAVIKIEGGLIKVSGLAVGNYTMNVTTVPDANHTAVSKLVNVTVNKISDYTMDVNSTAVQQGDNTTVTVTVPENATGNVTVTLSNGTNYTAEVKNGTATVNVGKLPAGDNNLTVSYSGDDIYAGKTSDVTAHVKELVILAGDLVRGWDSPYDYLAKLLDEDGNPAVGRTLVFVVGGKEYNATTDSSGLAKLTTSKLDVGKYDVTTKYPENGANETHKIEIVARIIENKDLVMDYKDGHKFRVRAIGDDGNPVGAGVVVKIKINGVTYKPKTDKKGYAALPINLIPRKYVATATYHNYAVKNKVKVRQILKLVKKTVKVKKGKKIVLKAKLKKTNGKALKGKKITFKFKGKKYKAKTNKKGIAKVTIKKKKVLKKLKKGKKYKYSAKYIKDVVKGKVKIKK